MKENNINRLFIKIASALLFFSMLFQYIRISKMDIGLLVDSNSSFTYSYVLIMLLVIPLILTVLLFIPTFFVIKVNIFIPIYKVEEGFITFSRPKEIFYALSTILNRNKYTVVRC